MLKNPKNYLALVAGIFYALGFPSVLAESIVLAPILGFALLFFLLSQKETLKEKLFLSLLFGIGFNYSGFYWITNTLEVFGNLPWIVAALLSSLFSFVVMIYLWPVTMIWHYLQKKNWLPHTSFKILVIALLFTIIEYFSPEQFPTWIGQPWVTYSKYLGAAHIYGIPGFSFVSFILVFLFLNYKKILSFKIPLTIVLIFILQNLFTSPPQFSETQKLNVRVVQANIGNYLKLESEAGEEDAVEKVLGRYQKLSTLASDKQIDLIIWPETAYPYSVISSDMKKSTEASPAIIQKVIQDTHAEFLTGGYDENLNRQKDDYQVEYNSSFFIGRNGLLKDVYHKHILIPFGETLPFGPFTKYLAKYITGVSYFSQGVDFPVFQTENGVKFVTPICYELLKPEFFREYFNRQKEMPNLIINMTNDSWYGKTAEPYQHLFLAKWRALEFQMPIIRSTNTGITSVIFQDGSESSRLLTGEEKNLDVLLEVPSQNTATPFQIYGFLTTLMISLIGILIEFIWCWKRKIPL
jgi:apolipoprotein N-acyltransferase